MMFAHFGGARLPNGQSRFAKEQIFALHVALFGQAARRAVTLRLTTARRGYWPNNVAVKITSVAPQKSRCRSGASPHQIGAGRTPFTFHVSPFSFLTAGSFCFNDNTGAKISPCFSARASTSSEVKLSGRLFLAD